MEVIKSELMFPGPEPCGDPARHIWQRAIDSKQQGFSSINDTNVGLCSS